jgi:hypothetical protein
MPSKKHNPEEIIGKLREVDVVLSSTPSGTTPGTIRAACRPGAIISFAWRDFARP